MRLSGAMMLGSATCKMVATDMNSCGLGCALNAIGYERAPVGETWCRYAQVAKEWPWLSDAYGESVNAFGERIYSMFDLKVCKGKMTFEQLVDYVRSIEPDCDCNRFGCDCAKAEQAVIEIEAGYANR